MVRLLFALLACALGTPAQACPEVSPSAIVDWRGTPLHDAIRHNDVGAFGRLLSAATVNEPDSRGNTPLVAALTPAAVLEPAGVVSMEVARARIAAENAARQTMVAELLAKGAAVNQSGVNGSTPLMQLAAWGFSAAVDRRLAEALLRLGEDVNAEDQFGSTALMLAARRGKMDLVKLLLAKGANHRIKNCHGETASSLARFGGYSAVAAVLAE